jgi:aspartokinase-like uncharacterized kinase
LDAVIKVGGSLAEQPQALKNLCNELSRTAKKHALAVVPGGGKFADAVRELDAKFHLPAEAAHRLAILAMDQYGLFLAELIPDCRVCRAVKDAEEAAKNGYVAGFLPAAMLAEHDPFMPSWDVTSDSIAAYIAVRLKVAKVLFATDVDGIFTKDPKTHADAKLLSKVAAAELLGMAERTSVDKFLPKVLMENPLDSYVVNGCFPQRIIHILEGKPAVCTRILVR